MKQINDFSDERQKSRCIYCGHCIFNLETNRDHVPTKALLKKPYPPNLPTIQVCAKCNESFSFDEEYAGLFLKCLIAGSADPDVHSDAHVKKQLEKKTNLQKRLKKSNTDFFTVSENSIPLWKPETDRIKRVLLKNARGHIFYECGEPMLSKVETINMMPVLCMTPDEVFQFEHANSHGLFAEVGSRMMQRGITGADFREDWVIVQDGIYRFSILPDMTVKIILYEYLAVEISWNPSEFASFVEFESKSKNCEINLFSW